MGGGLVGWLILIADVWAIVKVFESGVRTREKVFWMIIIMVFPVAGLILWYLWGPKEKFWY